MNAEQLKYAEKYRDVLLYIYKISNGLATQEDLCKVLLKTKYCANKTTVTRIVKRLEDAKLIKRGQHKRSKVKTIELKKAAIDYLEDDKGKVYNLQILDGSGNIRTIRNSFSTQFFFREFVENKNTTLNDALDKALKQSVNNLYRESSCFYIVLSKLHNLPFKSFQSRECTFFKQQDIIAKKKAYRKDLFLYSIKKKRGEEVGEPSVANISKSWTLDDLKRRQVYLHSISFKQSELYKDKKREDYKPLVLCLNFKHFNYSINPKPLDLLRLYQNLQRYIKKTYQMHYESFLRKHQILESIVQIEVEFEIILLNKTVYDMSKDSILNRLPNEPVYTSGSRHIFDFKLSHLDVMPKNQHLK